MLSVSSVNCSNLATKMGGFGRSDSSELAGQVQNLNLNLTHLFGGTKQLTKTTQCSKTTAKEPIKQQNSLLPLSLPTQIPLGLAVPTGKEEKLQQNPAIGSLWQVFPTQSMNFLVPPESLLTGSLLNNNLLLPFLSKPVAPLPTQSDLNVNLKRNVTAAYETQEKPTSPKKKRSYSRACSSPGCTKLARGRGLCKGHGGGRRCHKPGCTKSARSGSNFCTAHGGGRRCHVESCTKGAEGSSYYCVAHGGGKRCVSPGCTKKDQGGGFCKAHGGGKRCAFRFLDSSRCTRTAMSRKSFCSAHNAQ